MSASELDDRPEPVVHMCDAGGPTGSSLRRRLDHELRRRSPVDRYESLTNLCPPSICGDLERQPFGQALEDASVVYGHRVVPESLRDGLPSIVSSWGDFGAEDDAGDSTQDAQNVDGQTYTDKAYSLWRERGADEKSPLGQIGTLQERVAQIEAEPSVSFTHVVSPHRPWNLSPSGAVLSYDPLTAIDPDANGFEFNTLRNFQLHSMQTGAIDNVVGDLSTASSRCRRGGHVARRHRRPRLQLTPPDIGRKVTDATAEDIFRVPLFIKAPGQTEGEVIDDSAQAVDVLRP